MKDDKEVISEFNEYVNMTASELEKWLKSDDSNSAGWSKGDEGGESVGHDSGRKIVEILKSNPGKKPDKYTDEQLQHMRKVASYCKRHLAQESAGNKAKDPDEVKGTKSYISLKNWGHDFLKAQGKDSGTTNGSGSKSGSKEQKKDEDEDVEEEQEDDDQEDEEGEDEDKKTGDKRKKSGQQNGSNKKRETRQTRSSTKENEDDQDAEDDQEDEDDDAGEENGEEEEEEEEDEDGGDSGEKSSKKGPKKGQTVSWNWGSGNPRGKVLDVKEDKYVSRIQNMANLQRQTNDGIEQPLQQSEAIKYPATATQRIQPSFSILGSPRPSSRLMS